LERKQATHPELLCRGYPTEFKDYFAHCSSLGFEDRPDYRLLKRIFKDLFERQGFEDDGIFDWDILKKQRDQGVTLPPGVGGVAGGDGKSGNGEGEEDADDEKKALPEGLNLGNDGNNLAVSGASSPRLQQLQQSGRPSVNGEENSRQNDDAGENKDAGPRRSIISSIRQSLFGSREGITGSRVQSQQRKHDCCDVNTDLFVEAC
jgi:hypothetical protein